VAETRVLTFREALREALLQEMRRDPSVFVLGEDVGTYGGIFKVTEGLAEEFGEERVRDAPISEAAIAGAALGAALAGMRPVAEIMFMDFTTLAMDQIVNQAAKLRYMSGGKLRAPMVVRTPSGTGRSAAAQHSQSLEAWFMHVPGLKVVMPSTPADAKGLLTSAIRDDDPVMVIEQKLLYTLEGEVPEGEHVVPIGRAEVRRLGRDVTVVATGLMVHRAIEAASTLEESGVDVEVLDLRTLRPLDAGAVLESVRKTGRLVIVHEACKTAGPGAEVAALVAQEAIEYLDSPIVRVAGWDVPVPFSPPMEEACVPSADDIAGAVRELVGDG